jgi:mannose-6-phosphate isomerase-like protein (cupin superfamily)
VGNRLNPARRPPNRTRGHAILITCPPTIIGPTDGESVTLQTIGVRFMIPGADTDTRFSLVEHPFPPRALAAPLHRHNREDEYSYIVEGRMGALIGDDVVEAGPRDLVHKPRGQWHTFWNTGDEPARRPAGFFRARRRASRGHWFKHSSEH